jgi:hypothetical protein
MEHGVRSSELEAREVASVAAETERPAADAFHCHGAQDQVVGLGADAEKGAPDRWIGR